MSDQPSLFEVELKLHSVPVPRGCFHCSYCRKPFPDSLQDNHHYWTHDGRQYRTHDGCYEPAKVAPEVIAHVEARETAAARCQAEYDARQRA